MPNRLKIKSTAKLADLPNLALARLGAKVIDVSDDFFASASGIIKPQPPVFIPDKFTVRGKWMDGWESRRRRDKGNDYLVLQLGNQAHIHALGIDTAHYTGNYPLATSVEVANQTKPKRWTPLIGKTKLKPDNQQLLATDPTASWKFLRLQIYPDGGIARLKVYGTFAKELKPGQRYDLASLLNGTSVVGYSDAHYGIPVNMLLPDKGINMGDGWETRRSRTPGNLDWAIIALAGKGVLKQAVIDTSFFKGNFPDTCSLQAAYVALGSKPPTERSSQAWPTILKRCKLRASTIHKFPLSGSKSVSHVRLNIYPDGGISRLRLFGNAC